MLRESLERQRKEVDADLKRIADAYGAKMEEYRKVSHGIVGIDEEIKRLRNEMERI
ncbi:MAG: hypothetical protein ACQEXB_24375 [Bacillota bacterium]